MVVPSCWVRYAFARDKVSISEAKSIWKKLRVALRKLAKTDEKLLLEVACPTTEVLFHQVDSSRLKDDPLVDFLIIAEEVSELPMWERFLVSGIEETGVFTLGLEWKDSQSEVIIAFDLRQSRLEFALIQRDHFLKQSKASPGWTSFVSFLDLKKEFDGTTQEGDWIPILVSKKALSRKFDGKSAFELELGGDSDLTLIHNSAQPEIYIRYVRPLSSIKEGLRMSQELAESISDPKNPPKATLNFQVESGDLKKYLKRSKSAGALWTSVQYIGDDTDDDDEPNSPTPDPFDVEVLVNSELSTFPIVTLLKGDLLCLQINMVYTLDGSYLEFVSNAPEDWFNWVENQTERKLDRWTGDAKGRWGWYSK